MQGSESSANGAASGGAAAPASPRRRFDYGAAAPEAKVETAAVAAIGEVGEATPALATGKTLTSFDARTMIVLGGLFVLAFGYFYWWNLKLLAGVWWDDAAWSHGFIVPFLCAYLVWLRWGELKKIEIKPAHIGLVIVSIGIIGKILFVASRTATTHVEHLSMLVVLMGAALWVLGWNFAKVLWLPISYFVFAINPPGQLYQKLTAPMQDLAAQLSEKMLVLVGIRAEAMGNQLFVTVGNVTKDVNVAEACSGMKMLIAFVALATVLAYSTSRPMWQKIFLVLCAFPVAIFCNGLRIGIIAMLVVNDPAETSNWAHGDAHGFIGLLMLAPAMGLQILIGWILSRIFVDDSATTGGEAAKGGA